MSKDFELGKRIAWLRKSRSLEQKEAARRMGINYYTYQPYEYGNTPGRKNIDKIIAYYKCDKAWLLTGQGEPFPGGGEKHSDVNETGPAYADHVSPLEWQVHQDGEISISEALQMTARVLESKTSYARALYLSIRHFDRAVSAEDRIDHLERSQKVLEERINDLLRDFEKLRNENTQLQSEVDRLKTI